MSRRIIILIFFLIATSTIARTQTNLLLNSGFEDINTCTEYKSECGVEGWFYLKEVKAQMLLNENNIQLVGANSYGIFSTWNGYTDFIPVIGSLLPCGLQKGKRYTFKGILSATLNPRLILRPGFCIGEKFYVPRRAFVKNMQPVAIPTITPVSNTNFYSFEYSFTADENARYLTFGTYIEEDTVGAKKKLIGTQTVSMVLDNFQLIPEDPNEAPCPDFAANKAIIYEYNFRHKEMDYSLYAKGELEIEFDYNPVRFTTAIQQLPPAPVQPDTLKLGDVFFDFNKAQLKPDALKMLSAYFIKNKMEQTIDSIYIDGHTDSIGSDQRNMVLSTERCEAVKKWMLLNSVITESQSTIHPFGRSRPVATNKTASGRALNRRVELIIFRKVRREP